jgi:hypothetical protein
VESAVRAQLPKLDVPTPALDGTADRILPDHRHGRPAAGINRRCPSREGRGRTAQHRLDPPEEVNKALLGFVDERDKKLAGG